MPIYEFLCRDCGERFEMLFRTFERGDISCPRCKGRCVEKLFSSPIIRMGKKGEPSTEFGAKEEEINYYKDKGEYEKAAKAAERLGKSEWEIKDLYRKAGKQV